MSKEDFLNYKPYWVRRLFRTVMLIGAVMTMFACCVWSYQQAPEPWYVLMILLVGMIPILVGQWLSTRVPGGMALPAMLLSVLAAGVALGLRLWLPDQGKPEIPLLTLSAFVSEALMTASDERAELPMLPGHLLPASKRIRSLSVIAAGVIGPLAAALLMARSAYASVAYIAQYVLMAGAVLSLIWSIPALRKPAAGRAAVTRKETAPDAELTAACLLQNLCLASTQGALLIPLVLSRATVSSLASVVIWFFIGVALGQLFDPMQYLRKGNSWEYKWDTALAIISMALVFGVCRTGWQWSICSAIGGAAIAAGWGDLHELGLVDNRWMNAAKAVAWIVGLPLGIGIGSALEWITERVGWAAGICARLTGLGEGSGMAMTFVVVGFCSLVARYLCNRILKNR